MRTARVARLLARVPGALQALQAGRQALQRYLDRGVACERAGQCHLLALVRATMYPELREMQDAPAARQEALQHYWDVGTSR